MRPGDVFFSSSAHSVTSGMTMFNLAYNIVTRTGVQRMVQQGLDVAAAYREGDNKDRRARKERPHLFNLLNKISWWRELTKKGPTTESELMGAYETLEKHASGGRDMLMQACRSSRIEVKDGDEKMDRGSTEYAQCDECGEGVVQEAYSVADSSGAKMLLQRVCARCALSFVSRGGKVKKTLIRTRLGE